jgi:hypothetical protein
MWRGFARSLLGGDSPSLLNAMPSRARHERDPERAKRANLEPPVFSLCAMLHP